MSVRPASLDRETDQPDLAADVELARLGLLPRVREPHAQRLRLARRALQRVQRGPLASRLQRDPRLLLPGDGLGLLRVERPARLVRVAAGLPEQPHLVAHRRRVPLPLDAREPRSGPGLVAPSWGAVEVLGDRLADGGDGELLLL